jgi:hypothetical protein
VTDDPVIRSLYEPATGMIPCVIIQAIYGGDRRPCGMFGPGDWNTSLPHESAIMMSAPLSQWREVAMMSREERIERLQHLMKKEDIPA